LDFPTKERIGHWALPKQLNGSPIDLLPMAHLAFILGFRWTVNARLVNARRANARRPIWHRIAPIEPVDM
jgi:hypothetical protein